MSCYVHRLISILVIFLSSTLLAQAPDTVWTQTYGDAGLDVLVSVKQTPDGGFIMAGGLAVDGPTSDFWLVKTNAQGDTSWTRTYGGDSWDNCFSMQITSDSGFILVGGTESFGVNERRIWLVRTDSKGDTLWTKTYGKYLLSDGNSIVETSDSGFVIVGNTGPDDDSLDVYLLRTDSVGDTLWTKTFGGSNNDEGYSVQQTFDGGYIIGAHKSVNDSAAIWLLKTGADGDTTWTKTFVLGSGEGTKVVQTADSGYAIFGVMFGTLDTPLPDEPNDRDWLLIKTDSLGALQWSNTYGGDFQDQSADMALTNDGGFLLTGWWDLTGASNVDLWLLKVDTIGDSVWSSTVGDTGLDLGVSIVELAEGEYAVAGITDGFGAVSYDGWLVRFGASANAVTERSGTPGAFALHANYPNPFNPATTIGFNLPRATVVTLTVYDILGREVQQLANRPMGAGYHQATWNGRDTNGRSAPTGIYFARLAAPGYTQTIKMVLLK